MVGGCVLFMKNVVKGFGFGIFIMVEKSYIIVVFGFWSSGYYICDESIWYINFYKKLRLIYW